jgi:hypothetical protein
VSSEPSPHETLADQLVPDLLSCHILGAAIDTATPGLGRNLAGRDGQISETRSIGPSD